MKKEFHTNNSNSMLVIKRGWLPFIYRGKTEIGRRMAAALFMAAMGFGSAFFASAGFADQTPVSTIDAEANQTAVISMDSGLTPAVQITKESGTDTEVLNTAGTLNLNGGTVSQNIDETGTQAVNLGTGTDRNFNFSWGTNGGTIDTGADNSLDINVDHTASGLTKTGAGTLTLSGTGTQAFNGLNVDEGTVNLTGAATVADDATLKTGSITNLNGATFNGNLTADGTLGVTGNLTANGTDKTATFGNGTDAAATTVTGTSEFNNLVVNDKASLTSDGKLTANNDATLAAGSTTNAKYGAEFKGNLDSNGQLTVTYLKANEAGKTANIGGNTSATGTSDFNNLNVNNGASLTSDGKLTANDNATLAAGSTTTAKSSTEFKGNLDSNGQLVINGNLKANEAGKTANIGGNTSATGTSDFNNLNVNNGASLTSGDKLTATGAATLNNGSTTTAKADATFKDNLDSNGTLDVTGNLAVDKNATIGGTTTVSGTTTANNLTVNDNGTLDSAGATTVAGATTLNGTSTITNALNANGTLNVNGAATVGSLGQDVKGAATLADGSSLTVKAGDATFGSTTSMTNANLTAANATFKGTATLSGDNTVTGNATFNEDQTIGSTDSLNVTGTTTFDKTLTNSGTLTSGDKLTATGAATLAAGSTTTAAKNGAEFKDDLTANGTLGVTGNLTANGTDKTATFGNGTDAATTTVTGTSDFNNLTVNDKASLTSDDKLTANDDATLAAGSTTTANNGAEFKKNLTAGGTLNVQNGLNASGVDSTANFQAGSITKVTEGATFAGQLENSGSVEVTTGNLAVTNADKTAQLKSGSTTDVKAGSATFDGAVNLEATAQLLASQMLTIAKSATLNAGSTTTVGQNATFNDNLNADGTMTVGGNLVANTAGKTATFGNGTVAATTTVTGTSDFNNLVVNDKASLTSDDKLTATGAATLVAGSTTTANNGAEFKSTLGMGAGAALTVNGANMAVTGNSTITGGADADNATKITLGTGLTSDFNGSLAFNNGFTTLNSGTFNANDSMSLNTATVTIDAGTLNINDSLTFAAGESALKKANDGSIVFGESSTVNVDKGATVKLDGPTNFNGLVNFNTGSATGPATLTINGATEGSYETVAFGKTVTIESGDAIINSTAATFQQNQEIISGASLTLNQGTVTFNGTLDNSGILTVENGLLTVTGAATLNNGSTTTAKVGATFKDNLNSNGTFDVTGNLIANEAGKTATFGNGTDAAATTVTGTSDFNILNVNNGANLTSNGKLTANDDATLAASSTTTANNGAEFKGNLDSNGQLVVTGNLTANEAGKTANIGGNTSATGTSDFNILNVNNGASLTSDGKLTANDNATLAAGSTTTANNGAEFKGKLTLLDGTAENYAELTVNSELTTVVGEVKLGDFSITNLNKDAAFGSSLTTGASASLTVNDALGVVQAAEFGKSSTTTVSGMALFNGSLTTQESAELTINGQTLVMGDATLNAGSKTTAKAGATFAGQFDNSGSVEVTTGDLAVTNADKTAQLKSGSTTDVKAGSATFNGAVNLEATAQLLANQMLNIAKSATLAAGSTTTVGQNATFNDNLNADGTMTVGGNLVANTAEKTATFGNGTDAAATTVTGTSDFNNLVVNDKASLTSDGKLTANDNATLAAGSTTTAKSSAEFKGNLDSNGQLVVTGNLTANEAGKTANIGGNTSATGTSDFNILNVNNGANLTSNGKLTANDDATLAAGSTTTANNGAEFNGKLTLLDGTAENYAKLTVNSELTTVVGEVKLGDFSITNLNKDAAFGSSLTTGASASLTVNDALGVVQTAEFGKSSTTTVSGMALFNGSLTTQESAELTINGQTLVMGDATLGKGSNTTVNNAATFNSSVKMSGANLTTANGATFMDQVTFDDGKANTITTTDSEGTTTFEKSQSFTDQTILTLTGPGATNFKETGTFTNSTLTVNDGTVTFDKTMGFVGDVKFNSAGAGTIVFADNEFLLFDSNNSINTITAMTDMKFSGDETKLANDIHFEEQKLYCHSDITPSVFNGRVYIDSNITLLSNNIFNKDTSLNSIERPYITYYDKDNNDTGHIVEGGWVDSNPSEALLLGKNTFNDNVTFSGKHEILLLDENNKLTLDNDKAVSSNIAHSLNVTFGGDTVFSKPMSPMIDESGNQLYHNPEYDPYYSLSDGDEGYDSNKTIQYITEASTNGTDNKIAYQASVVFDSVYATNYIDDDTIGSLTFGENTLVQVKDNSLLEIGIRAEYDEDKNIINVNSKNIDVNIDVDGTSSVLINTIAKSQNSVEVSSKDLNVDLSFSYSDIITNSSTPEVAGDSIAFSYRDATSDLLASANSENKKIFEYDKKLLGYGNVLKTGNGVLLLKNTFDDNYDNNHTSLHIVNGSVIIEEEKTYKGGEIVVYQQNDDRNRDNIAVLGSQGSLGFQAGSSIDVSELRVLPGGDREVQYKGQDRSFETGGELWFDLKKNPYVDNQEITITSESLVMDDSAYMYYESLSTLEEGESRTIKIVAKNLSGFAIDDKDISDKSLQAEDLERYFAKPLANVSATVDGTGVVLTISANNKEGFVKDYWNDITRAQSNLMSALDQDRINPKINSGWKNFLDAVWNDSDPEIIKAHVTNLSRNGGMENVTNMTFQQLGSVGSNFWSGCAGFGTFSDLSTGTLTRGQSKAEKNKNALSGGCGLGSLLDGWTVWGGPSYTSIDARGYNNQDGFSVSRAGFLAGLRRQFDDKTSGGFIFAYSDPELNQSGSFADQEQPSSWDNASYKSEVAMNDYQVAMHLEHVFCEKYEASFFLGTGAQYLDWDRSLFVKGDSAISQRQYTGATKGNTLTFTAYLARPIEMSKNFVLRPTIGLDSEHSWLYSFEESGDDFTFTMATDYLSQRFRYSKVQYSRNMGRVGLVAGLTGCENRLGMSGRIFYGVALGGEDSACVTQTPLGMEGAASVDRYGLAIGNDSWNLGYGMFYYLNAAKTFSISADYNAIMYQHATTQNVTAGVQYKF